MSNNPAPATQLAGYDLAIVGHVPLSRRPYPYVFNVHHKPWEGKWWCDRATFDVRRLAFGVQRRFPSKPGRLAYVGKASRLTSPGFTPGKSKPGRRPA
jgi:hypothetical protein